LMYEKGVWVFKLDTAPPLIDSGEDDLSDWDDKPTFRRKTPKG